jgi:hypothetical protein
MLHNAEVGITTLQQKSLLISRFNHGHGQWSLSYCVLTGFHLAGRVII